MLNIKIIKNEEVTLDILEQVEEFDRKIFPSDSEYTFPSGYITSLYEENREGIFVLLNNDRVIGYCNVVFLTEDAFKRYLINPNYKNLYNIGMHDGDNYMYFHTVAIDQDIRHTSFVKFLMYEFSRYLASERLKGRKVVGSITEVITDDGLRCAKIMGFKPIDNGERDFGLYYSEDNLLGYIKKMLESDNNLKAFNSLYKELKKSSDLLDKFSTKEEAVLYLTKKTGIAKSECALAYDFIKDIKFEVFTDNKEREKESEFASKVVELAEKYKLPVFAVTSGLVTYHNPNYDSVVETARDVYLKYIEEEEDSKY